MATLRQFLSTLVNVFRKQSSLRKIGVGIVFLFSRFCICAFSTLFLPDTEESSRPDPTIQPILTEISPLNALTLPLAVNSDGWRFIIQRVDTFTTLEGSSKIVEPDEDIFLALVCDLESIGDDGECITTTDWRLTSSETEERYSYSFYAETPLKEHYNLDGPGAFIGTCLSGYERKKVLLVFDVADNVGAQSGP